MVNTFFGTGNRKHTSCAINRLRMSKMTLTVALAFYIAIVGSSGSVLATSFFPAPFYHKQEKVETPMRAGDTVYLFHSGTADVKKNIHASDILTVHRISPSCEVRQVGKIKAMSFVGETYLKCIVTEGEILPHDIAQKGDVSFLVILTGVCPP